MVTNPTEYLDGYDAGRTAAFADIYADVAIDDVRGMEPNCETGMRRDPNATADWLRGYDEGVDAQICERVWAEGRANGTIKTSTDSEVDRFRLALEQAGAKPPVNTMRAEVARNQFAGLN